MAVYNTQTSTMDRTAESSWTGGLVTFAGVLMLVGGVWHVLAGIAALVEDELYVSTPNYVYSLDLTGWGWGHVVIGALVASAGGAVLKGLAVGRIVGVVLAAFSLVTNFAFIPWYPIWSLAIIALDIAVIAALVIWQPARRRG